MGRHISNRLVPDPSMSDAEYIHQRNRERERAEALGVEPKLTIGKVWAQENAVTRMGALCFIRRRQQHHELAAERFKTLYETCYGSGNPGLDPSRVQVDTSARAHDNNIIVRISKADKLREAKDGLGDHAFNRVIACVVLEIPAGEGLHWRARTAMVDLVLNDLERLAVIWKLSTVPLKGNFDGRLGLEPAA